MESERNKMFTKSFSRMFQMLSHNKFWKGGKLCQQLSNVENTRTYFFFAGSDFLFFFHENTEELAL